MFIPVKKKKNLLKIWIEPYIYPSYITGSFQILEEKKKKKKYLEEIKKKNL